MAMVNICVIEFNVLYKHFKKIVKKNDETQRGKKF